MIEENENKANIFIKVRKIISEKLEIDENKIDLDSHLEDNLYADLMSYYIELLVALEEEFHIEISENETEDKLGIFDNRVSCWSMAGSISSYSSDRITGSSCIVRSFVDLIYEKVSLDNSG